MREAIVCPEHKADLDSGAAWSWDPEASRILMAADAYPRVTRWHTMEGGGSSEVGPGFVVRLELTRPGQMAELVDAWMSYAEASEIGEWLALLGETRRAK